MKEGRNKQTALKSFCRIKKKLDCKFLCHKAGLAIRIYAVVQIYPFKKVRGDVRAF